MYIYSGIYIIYTLYISCGDHSAKKIYKCKFKICQIKFYCVISSGTINLHCRLSNVICIDLE